MKDDIYKQIIQVVCLLAVVAVNTIVRGWLIVKLWGWFITPLFNMQPPSVVNAIGFSLFVTYLAFIPSKTETRPVGDSLKNALRYGLTVPPIVFLVGWLVSGFMP
jgi:hypothetical protein